MLVTPENISGNRLMIPGFHATQSEVSFVDQVVRDYIKPKYQGPIKLVGSRAAPDGPRWISWKGFAKSIEAYKEDFRQPLPNDVVDAWISSINRMAREQGLHRDQIPTLAKQISGLKNIYDLSSPDYSVLQRSTEFFLKGGVGVPGSDIDLLLTDIHTPQGFIKPYSDLDSSQVADFFYNKAGV